MSNEHSNALSLQLMSSPVRTPGRPLIKTFGDPPDETELWHDEPQQCVAHASPTLTAPRPLTNVSIDASILGLDGKHP